MCLSTYHPLFSLPPTPVVPAQSFTRSHYFLSQVFASHAIGGVVGNLLTGIFAQASVANFDGTTVIPGGWLDHHYIQLAWHVADSAAGMGYSFAMTVSAPFPLSPALFLI